MSQIPKPENQPNAQIPEMKILCTFANAAASMDGHGRLRLWRGRLSVGVCMCDAALCTVVGGVGGDDAVLSSLLSAGDTLLADGVVFHHCRNAYICG